MFTGTSSSCLNRWAHPHYLRVAGYRVCLTQICAQGSGEEHGETAKRPMSMAELRQRGQTKDASPSQQPNNQRASKARKLAGLENQGLMPASTQPGVQERAQQPVKPIHQEIEDDDDGHAPTTSTARPLKRPHTYGPKVYLVAAEKRGQVQAAVETGLRMLTRRALSVSELQSKLQLKGYEDSAVEGAVVRLKELGEIDDARYAALYIRSKWRASQRGPQMLEMELKRKGVEEGLIKDALAAFFKNDLTASGWDAYDDEQVEEPVLGFESQQRHLMLDLVAVAERRLNNMAALPKEKKVQRLSGWLARRGHSWDTVKAVLKKLSLM